ncbi:transcription elongation protein SprT [Chryseobacterium sp. T16E-39]|uniref:SprT-like domain-containing protein n=1 Tax=Chryseobacterium sp. T16E-39 TaxID=2015076 RepID=UPI000B5B4625|nr:SprT-like domain-containing protein [Chryseobacterium sp. T16E-39]ASK31285.1 transcription elongation protein SprT [Chryseobacterium sp. T16E-39]
MSIQSLEKYLPQNTLQYLKIWFSDYYIHIKITRNRNSKLGDYRKLPDHSHEITINSTLAPQLFFFVLTHELAHLIAFEKYGRRISPHGNEWKDTFRRMLLESVEVYEDALRPIIIKFSRSPKANFMASPDLVKYFHIEKQDDKLQFIEELEKGDFFMYRNEKYFLEGLIKKNYLCKNLASGRKYSFKPLARVEKCS